LLHVSVHAANIHDTIAGASVFKEALRKYPTIEAVCGDSGYRGTFVLEMSSIGKKVDIVERLGTGWVVLPKRWRVERTFGWMNNSRRLSKDYEINTSSSEAMVCISHIYTLLKRF